jgi:hypothetical protein
LVALFAAAVPAFVAEVFQALGVEVDEISKIWTANSADSAIEIERFLEDVIKFLVCKAE